MTDLKPAAVFTEAREQFELLVRDIRIDLHRYCARMTGSVVDGEDVVQDALARAYYMLPTVESVTNLRGWLFRIAHNKALDFLRGYDRRFGEPLGDHFDGLEENDPLEAAETAELALSHYLTLTALQRSCVIMKDVMGYALAEMSEILDISVPAIKGALHRGRAALREHADATRHDHAARLEPEEARLLAVYVDYFNARDFDALRDLLVDDAKLELVGRSAVRGSRGVGQYFSNYERITGWRLQAGRVDGRPAVLGFDEIESPSYPNERPVVEMRPTFFILIRWRGRQIESIRDYRYARHVTELAEFDLEV